MPQCAWHSLKPTRPAVPAPLYARPLPYLACRRIPDPSLGLLLDRCSKMERLVAYGLNQITTTTLYGHSNGAVRVEGLHTSVSTKKLRQQQAGRS